MSLTQGPGRCRTLQPAPARGVTFLQKQACDTSLSFTPWKLEDMGGVEGEGGLACPWLPGSVVETVLFPGQGPGEAARLGGAVATGSSALGLPCGESGRGGMGIWGMEERLAWRLFWALLPWAWQLSILGWDVLGQRERGAASGACDCPCA